MYHFPYTNFHDLNLDWIIEYVKSAKREIEDLINHFENLIVQTTGDSTTQVMSQNAVTVQLNFLSSRINTLNTTTEELTAKLNEDIANLAEFETETSSNFSSDRKRLSTIENALTRFYVIVTHTEESNTLNVSFSDLLNYRRSANVRYYIKDNVQGLIRSAYEVGNPASTTLTIQTSPYSQENKIYRADISVATSTIIYSTLAIIAVAQSSGLSQTSVMSQRAVTEAVNRTSLHVKFTISPQSSRCNYSFATISEYIEQNSVVYGDVSFTSTGRRVCCYLYNNDASAINFKELASYGAKTSFDISLTASDQVAYKEKSLVDISPYPHFVISSDGKTIPAGQLPILQNILNAIVVNDYSPQIYLNITTDNVTEQLYVDSANSTGYVLRNNNYIITYTTKPSATIEPVEKVFTSSATGVTRIAEGPEKGYNILKIIGTDVDLTNYYIVDADITKLIGGVSTLISVSPVSGVPVILLYSNGVAFSGSWTVTCRHK
jgi:hypothetical protein